MHFVVQNCDTILVGKVRSRRHNVSDGAERFLCRKLPRLDQVTSVPSAMVLVSAVNPSKSNVESVVTASWSIIDSESTWKEWLYIYHMGRTKYLPKKMDDWFYDSCWSGKHGNGEFLWNIGGTAMIYIPLSCQGTLLDQALPKRFIESHGSTDNDFSSLLWQVASQCYFSTQQWNLWPNNMTSSLCQWYPMIYSEHHVLWFRSGVGVCPCVEPKFKANKFGSEVSGSWCNFLIFPSHPLWLIAPIFAELFLHLQKHPKTIVQHDCSSFPK